jgi:serine O-acetyltransferase
MNINLQRMLILTLFVAGSHALLTTKSHHRFMRRSRCFISSSTNNALVSNATIGSQVPVHENWESLMGDSLNPYRSTLLFPLDKKWDEFLEDYRERCRSSMMVFDPFWEQTKLEAQAALELEPEAGPQIYQGILSQPSMLEAICTVISYDIQTELIPATAIKNLFLEILTPEDEYKIRMDLEAVATRSSDDGNVLDELLFHNGFHALVCYRVGHRLWQAERSGLAYYMQSTVSRTYSADIHPACLIGSGIFLRVGAGVVIGETAVIGNDTSILEGVTLGGTGNEAGDRHPKVGNGVIIQDGGTVLGNIPVGDGSVVVSKSIVTKPVPPLAIVSGVPARITGYRDLNEASFDDDLQHHLVGKYLEQWKQLYISQDSQ